MDFFFLACLCVCMCTVLDLCVWSSCATVQVAAFVSQLSLSSLHRIYQSLVIYFFVYCLPYGAVCSMRTGPRAVVVTAAFPALLCTQQVLSNYC